MLAQKHAICYSHLTGHKTGNALYLCSDTSYLYIEGREKTDSINQAVGRTSAIYYLPQHLLQTTAGQFEHDRSAYLTLI